MQSARSIQNAQAQAASAVHAKLREYYIRHFEMPNNVLHDILCKVLGPDTKERDPPGYALMRSKALGCIHQWKHQSIERFISHVKDLLEEKASPDIRASIDLETLRSFFAEHFSFEDLGWVFYWANSAVDIEKSANRVKNMLRTIYVNMCTQTKLYIGNPNDPATNKEALGQFWNGLGKGSVWAHVGTAHYCLRKSPPKPLRPRRQQSIPVPYDEDPRYNPLENAFDENEDKDHMAENVGKGNT